MKKQSTFWLEQVNANLYNIYTLAPLDLQYVIKGFCEKITNLGFCEKITNVAFCEKITNLAFCEKITNLAFCEKNNQSSIL